MKNNAKGYLQTGVLINTWSIKYTGGLYSMFDYKITLLQFYQDQLRVRITLLQFSGVFFVYYKVCVLLTFLSLDTVAKNLLS